MKKTAIALALSACVATPALATGFVNGGFEDGTYNGWEQGAGRLNNSNTTALLPNDFVSGGSAYNMGYWAGTVTTVGGIDPYSGLSTVYNGNHAVRVNDTNNNYSVNVVRQSVTNYTDNDMYFEWAAVLQASHGLTDSDAFNLTLVDNTTGNTLVTRSYSSASAPGVFNSWGGGAVWYSNWVVEHVDLTTAGAGGTSVVGHDFTLSLLATDCPYGGHWGYVYLDGFAPVIVTPGGNVPEPASLALVGLGLAGVASLRRRKSA